MSQELYGAIVISASCINRDLERGFGTEPNKDDVLAVAKHAMELALTEDCTWMLSVDSSRFLAGVGGLLFRYKDRAEVYALIEWELKMLQALAAAASGIPVDFGAMLAGEGDRKPLGLRRHFMNALWRRDKLPVIERGERELAKER